MKPKKQGTAHTKNKVHTKSALIAKKTSIIIKIIVADVHYHPLL